MQLRCSGSMQPITGLESKSKPPLLIMEWMFAYSKERSFAQPSRSSTGRAWTSLREEYKVEMFRRQRQQKGWKWRVRGAWWNLAAGGWFWNRGTHRCMLIRAKGIMRKVTAKKSILYVGGYFGLRWITCDIDDDANVRCLDRLLAGRPARPNEAGA